MILGIGVDSIEISPCCKSDGKRAFCPSHFYGKGMGGDGTRKKERCL